MPQEDQRPGDRNYNRMRPRDENGAPRKGPKFSIYWVWAIIFAVLVGFQIFGTFTPDAQTLKSEMDFRNNMLDKGDVEKLLLVTNKDLVRVFIKTDSLEKPYYRNKLNKRFFGSKKTGPHFEFSVAKADEFEKKMTAYFEA